MNVDLKMFKEFDKYCNIIHDSDNKLISYLSPSIYWNIDFNHDTIENNINLNLTYLNKIVKILQQKDTIMNNLSAK